MTEVMLQYALFLAEVATVVVAIGAVIAMAAGAARRGRPHGQLEVRCLNDRYRELERDLERAVLPRKAFRARGKELRKERKSWKASAEGRRRVFVLTFRGDVQASAVASLRDEITALLSVARPGDEVAVRLENSGGLVHEHGLAASQLLRVRAREIPLTVLVDKVAASGGYMMACTANRIVAAPFAILGSIGVLMQLPNFHRLLDANGVDFEQIKGGEYKRTLTMFGHNTDADRRKTREDVEDVHALFKEFVLRHRPDLQVDRVATGEHWYGTRALDLALCDDLRTSDDYLVEASRGADVYEVRIARRPKLVQRLATAAGALARRLPLEWAHGERMSRLAS